MLTTDESRLYSAVGKEFASHDFTTHGRGEYVRGEVTTNTVKGFFSIFKRGMRGIYQHCDENHLHRYLAEFEPATATVPRSAAMSLIAPTQCFAVSLASALPIKHLVRGVDAEEAAERDRRRAERALSKGRAKADRRWRPKPHRK